MIQSTILAQLTEYQHQQPEVKRWLLGLSGGVDSTVLLHALVAANQQLPNPYPIVALHINHQLSPQAADWEQHCRDYTQQLGVDYISETVIVQSQGKGVEAAARDARYQIFQEQLQAHDCLLLGHHQQDQAETLLLRLFRGAGVRGLAAMPSHRALGKGSLLRPLLGITREAIEAYAREHQLQWVDDPSNDSNDFDRNLLRNTLLPQLRQRWPQVDNTLADTSERMQHTEQLLVELAEQDLKSLDLQPARWGRSITLKPLQSFSFARIANLLRHWCRLSGYPVPEAEHLQHIQTQFFSRQAKLSSACVSWSKIQLRQFAGRLYLMPELPPFQGGDTTMEWHTNSPLDLKTAGQLQPLSADENSSILFPSLLLTAGDYTIRWRQGGERCTPVGRQHSQTVKKLLQEYQLETWLRDRVPLIYRDKTLIAVGDLWKNSEELDIESQTKNKTIAFNWVM